MEEGKIINESELSPKQRLELRKRVAKEKSEALKGEYQSIQNSAAFVDLLAKGRALATFHMKIAKDGVGYKEGVNDKGEVVQVEVKLSNDERLRELDRSAGLDELIGYIERQLD